MAVWVVLLLAAIGGLQYQQQAAWAYLLGAFAVIVICAGCILRQAWARQPMRIAAVLLAGWFLVTVILMSVRWGDFQRELETAAAQIPDTDALRQLLLARARRTYVVGLALKAALVPVLLWLAWTLGLAQVQAQFRRRGG